MFRYRAIKKNSSATLKWYLFQLRDCPALLWDDAFFLAGKPDTPVMLFETITRGHPTSNIFEGDRIIDKRSDKELGTVVYNNGFYMQKVGDSVRKPIPTGHIYVSMGDMESIMQVREFDRTPISFKYLDTTFTFEDLVKVDGDALGLIILGKTQKVNISGVSELLYYDTASQYKGYDGDVLQGKFLSLESVLSINKIQTEEM